MSSKPIFKQLTTVNQKQLTTEATGAVRALCVSVDGTVWSSQISAGKNRPVHVYRHGPEGNLVTTLDLPYPTRAPMDPKNPPIAPHALYLEGATLWITDYQYGVVYRYVVPEAKSATPIATATIFHEAKKPDPGKKLVQYGAMAFQKSGPAGKDTLWVLDTQGSLVGFDATAPTVSSAAYTIELGVRAQSVQSLVYHDKSKTLWMIAERTEGEFELAALPVASVPTQDKLKSFPLQDAQALFLDDNDLYVGGKKGQLWKIGVTAAPAELGVQATPVVTFLRPNTGKPINIFSLSVDKSGYVWVTDEDYGGTGNIYAISPPAGGGAAQVVLEYALVTNPKPAPGTLAWFGRPKDGVLEEALYVADQEHNGRVIKISPLPGVPPIKPDGKPAYTLVFVPPSAYEAPGGAFGKQAGIVLRAHPTGKPEVDIEGPVVLHVDTATGVKVSLKPEEDTRSTVTKSPFLAIKDLTVAADSGQGDCTLTAIGRGKPAAQAKFVGHVAATLEEIKLEDSVLKRIAVQQGAFNMPHTDVKVVSKPPASKASITVTLAGPTPQPQGAVAKEGDVAHFSNNAKTLTTTVIAGEVLPPVFAGNLAGKVIITPSSTPAASKSTPAEWLVIPVPTALHMPFNPNFTPRNFGESVAETKYTLTGFQRYGDAASGEVPTPGWKLKLTLDSITEVIFTGTSSSDGGKHLIVKTDDIGQAFVPADAIAPAVKGAMVTKSFTITAVWHSLLSGTGDSWVQTSMPYKTKFVMQTF